MTDKNDRPGVVVQLDEASFDDDSNDASSPKNPDLSKELVLLTYAKEHTSITDVVEQWIESYVQELEMPRKLMSRIAPYLCFTRDMSIVPRMLSIDEYVALLIRDETKGAHTTCELTKKLEAIGEGPHSFEEYWAFLKNGGINDECNARYDSLIRSLAKKSAERIYVPTAETLGLLVPDGEVIWQYHNYCKAKCIVALPCAQVRQVGENTPLIEIRKKPEQVRQCKFSCTDIALNPKPFLQFVELTGIRSVYGMVRSYADLRATISNLAQRISDFRQSGPDQFGNIGRDIHGFIDVMYQRLRTYNQQLTLDEGL